MPGKVKVRILAGRSLPVMDRSNDTTDAYVEVKLGQITHKTDVCRKSLNPQWNSEWFKFEMDDLELQDEPLQIRLMDYDTYSANDAIGKVYLDLNPLLINPSKGKDNWGRTISGWIPVYDTMHGIRGEVNVIVKVELFSDLNKYRQSSCGVKIFFSPVIPEGYAVHSVQGFVEELAVNDDPEYQWIDKIRTPRASNEARQTLFQKLSGEVQRKVGLKALELGGNAVVGYRQSLDLEGESGIVIRGIGTSMYLIRLFENQLSPTPINTEVVVTNNAAPKGSHPVCHQHSLHHVRNRNESKRPIAPSSSMFNNESEAFLSLSDTPTSTIKQQLKKSHNRTFSDSVRHGLGSGLSESFSNLVKANKSRSSSPGPAGNSNILLAGRKSPKKMLSFGASESKKPTNEIISSQYTQKQLKDKDTDTLNSDISKKDNATGQKSNNTNTNTISSMKLTKFVDSTTIRPCSSSSGLAIDIVDKRISHLKMHPYLDLALNIDFDKLANSEMSLGLSEISEEQESQSQSRRDSPQMPHQPERPISQPQEPSSTTSLKDKHEDINLAHLMALSLTLSEKESGESVSDDSPPTSPTSSIKKFALLRKKRWVSRRERLSTNCLVKRAGSNPSSTSSSGGKFKQELGKLFKKISFSEDKGADSDTNSNSNSTSAASAQPPLTTKKLEEKLKSPYRQPRKFFFRKRRRSRGSKGHSIILPSSAGHGHGQLLRTTSESFSFLQTSSESLPSIGSEPPAFRLGDDDDLSCSSLVEMPTYLQEHGTGEEKRQSKSPQQLNRDANVPSCSSVVAKVEESSSPVHVDPSKLRDLISDLGYDTEKPLKLYISSMDALLVYDPAHDAVNSSCVCLNPHVANNSASAASVSSISPQQTELKCESFDFSFDFDVDVELDEGNISNFNLIEKVGDLLKTRGKDNDERCSSPEVDSSSLIDKKEKVKQFQGQKKKRNRNNTLVECTKSNSNSSSSTNASSSSSCSSSGSSFSCSSSSCRLSLNQNRKLKMRRTDGDEIELDIDDELLLESETFLNRNPHDPVHGCRSPIPEEFVESAPATPTQNVASVLGSSPPPILSTNHSNTSPTKMASNKTNVHAENAGARMQSSPEKVPKSVTIVSPNKINHHQHHHNHAHHQHNMSHGQMYRRSSESDLSTTPKGGCGPPASMSLGKNLIHQRTWGINFEQMRMQEFPFLTISHFPEGFIYYLGGTVTARSVKLLDRIGNFEEPDPETRDTWWNEIRIEMRSHCRAFGCNIILGYEEQTTMCDDVCILSASGTAAIVISGNLDHLMEQEQQNIMDQKSHKRNDSFSTGQNNNSTAPKLSSPKTFQGKHSESDGTYSQCAMLHIPPLGSSFKAHLVKKTKCAYCRVGKVPEVLLTTIELPSGLHTTGRSCLIQTQVFRPKRDNKGEASAKEMSDSLPFLEYELHRRLINKLKIKGMNAIFGLQVQICQGEKLMIGIATGTAVFLTALPVPSLPIICSGNLKTTDSQKVIQFQKVIQETYDRNRDIYQTRHIIVPQLPANPNNSNINNNGGSISDADSDDEMNDEMNQNKETFVLEVDDAEDIEIISLLIDPLPVSGYTMSNIETLSGFEGHRVVVQQMFNQVWRCKIPTLTLRQLTGYFERLIRSITFKLRRMQPCILSKMSFRIDLPEPDEMQICIIGMAIGVDNKKASQLSLHPNSNSTNDDPEMMFTFDEDKEKLAQEDSSTENLHNAAASAGSRDKPALTSPNNLISKMSVSPSRNSSGVPLPINSVFGGPTNIPLPMSNMRAWVEITPLSGIPGTRIERYLGNLNFFFIRETTSLRESGGLSGFVHNFFTEVLAIVRAHVSALGGNAMVSYFMTECCLLHNPHKNQSQCVVNVGGDAVFVTYPIDHHPEDGVSV